RTSDQLLEEIVDNTREQLRREEIRLQRNDAFEEKLSKFTSLMEAFYQNAQSLHLDSSKPEEVLKNLITSQQEMPAHIQNILSNIGDISNMNEHFKSLVLNPPKEN
ncbi:hypothetical protein EAY03_25845, partial [Vibrio anguillarum]